MSWQPRVSEALGPDDIEAVMARTVPYVHVPRFLDPAWCEEIVRRFEAALDAMSGRRSIRMGPAMVDTIAMPVEVFLDSPERHRYFTHVEADQPRVRALFGGGPDPLRIVEDAWRAAGYRQVDAAEDAERRYLTDTVWSLRKAVALPHIDAYEHERESALSRFDRHINYNVYLQNGDSGGAFAVFRRFVANARAQDDIEAVVSVESLAGVERAEHRPSPGDLVMFDALFYHEVTTVDGTRKGRIQSHSNVLVDPDGREFTCFA